MLLLRRLLLLQSCCCASDVASEVLLMPFLTSLMLLKLLADVACAVTPERTMLLLFCDNVANP